MESRESNGRGRAGLKGGAALLRRFELLLIAGSERHIAALAPSSRLGGARSGAGLKPANAHVTAPVSLALLMRSTSDSCISLAETDGSMYESEELDAYTPITLVPRDGDCSSSSSRELSCLARQVRLRQHRVPALPPPIRGLPERANSEVHGRADQLCAGEAHPLDGRVDEAERYDANLGFLDPSQSFVVRAAESPSGQSYTPSKGQELTCKVVSSSAASSSRTAERSWKRRGRRNLKG